MQIIDPVMEDLRRTKEKLSLRYLSQTPEEHRLAMEETLKQAEAASGKPLKIIKASSEIFNSRLPK